MRDQARRQCQHSVWSGSFGSFSYQIISSSAGDPSSVRILKEEGKQRRRRYLGQGAWKTYVSQGNCKENKRNSVWRKLRGGGSCGTATQASRRFIRDPRDIHGDSSPFLLQPFHELSNGFWPRLTSPHPAIQFVPKMFYRVDVGALGGPVQSANIVVGVQLAVMQRRRKRENPEKTRRPAASSDTILTYENPRVAWPGSERGSPGWEASRLTAQPPRPPALTSPDEVGVFVPAVLQRDSSTVSHENTTAFATYVAPDLPPAPALPRPLHPPYPPPPEPLHALPHVSRPAPFEGCGRVFFVKVMNTSSATQHNPLLVQMNANTHSRGRGGLVVRLLASRLGEQGFSSRRGSSRILAHGNRAGTMPLVGGVFSEISRFPRLSHSGAAPYSPHESLHYSTQIHNRTVHPEEQRNLSHRCYRLDNVMPRNSAAVIWHGVVIGAKEDDIILHTQSDGATDSEIVLESIIVLLKWNGAIVEADGNRAINPRGTQNRITRGLCVMAILLPWQSPRLVGVSKHAPATLTSCLKSWCKKQNKFRNPYVARSHAVTSTARFADKKKQMPAAQSPGRTNSMACCWGRGGVAARAIAFHQGKPGQIPLPDMARGDRAGRCRWSACFLGDLPFHQLSDSMLTSALKTSFLTHSDGVYTIVYIEHVTSVRFSAKRLLDFDFQFQFFEIANSRLLDLKCDSSIVSSSIRNDMPECERRWMFGNMCLLQRMSADEHLMLVGRGEPDPTGCSRAHFTVNSLYLDSHIRQSFQRPSPSTQLPAMDVVSSPFKATLLQTEVRPRTAVASDKDENATHDKCPIAAMRKAFWTLVALRVPTGLPALTVLVDSLQEDSMLNPSKDEPSGLYSCLKHTTLLEVTRLPPRPDDVRNDTLVQCACEWYDNKGPTAIALNKSSSYTYQKCNHVLTHVKSTKEVTMSTISRPRVTLRPSVHNCEHYPRVVWSRAEKKEQIPEKAYRPTVSSETIPTCENPMARPGLNPGMRFVGLGPELGGMAGGGGQGCRGLETWGKIWHVYVAECLLSTAEPGNPLVVVVRRLKKNKRGRWEGTERRLLFGYATRQSPVDTLSIIIAYDKLRKDVPNVSGYAHKLGCTLMDRACCST
ncbi:hypothetical protein PR048_024004 [Dryococelus australis]|uniref:Uncharacterized protein n=1 Tax=Dryococelus australis TaxID=614101 RepID=A0ABQ9GVN7_9NEOP|nr:hypothetical protein PR048_024004 [Dryococelus australis]